MITVRNYCQVGSCGSKDTINFKMYNDFLKNWNFVKLPLYQIEDSLTVITTTGDGLYYVDETN